jgi:hypothetical protein
LEILICNNNQLTNLNEILNLINLEELECSNNNIKSINQIKNLKKLKILSCTYNDITNLDGIQNLINLKKLYCCHNKINNITNIINLPNLKLLECSHNNLTTLVGCKYIPNLQDLYCDYNKIYSLDEIHYLVKLKTLNTNNNLLTNLNGIEYLTDLEILNCANNKITNINPIKNLINLQQFYSNNNNITNIDELFNLTQIKVICVYDNQITTLNGIQNLVRLISCYYYPNPINYIPPNIIRFLNRLDTVSEKNIYNDSQNIHNHYIQESVKQSILNILNCKPSINNISEINKLIIDNKILSNQTKQLLIEYQNCKDIHISLNITFEELLLYVFDRIEQNIYKDEILKVLNIEMTDSVCKCFTGRINRLVNCLNGFDPLIKINISDSEQISQIIIQIRNELDQTNLYTISAHKQLVITRLKELQYTQDQIDIWIQHIE